MDHSDTQLTACYAFLRELDCELQNRIDGLEESVNGYNKLYHALKCTVRKDTQPSSTFKDIQVPHTSPGPAASVLASDELDGILEQARKVRVSDSTAAKSRPLSDAVGSSTKSKYAPHTRSAKDDKIRKSTVSRIAKPALASAAPPLDALDRILAQAKGMRTSSSATNESAPLPPDSTPSYGKEIPPPPPPIIMEPEPAVAPVLKADGRRVERLLASLWAADRHVIDMQTCVLSDAAGEVVFPQSISYYTLKSALSQSAICIPPTARLLEEGAKQMKADRSECYLDLTKMLRDNRKKYTKHMKRMLREGEKVSSIGPADREELFKYWYEHHALLELYEVLRMDKGNVHMDDADIIGNNHIYSDGIITAEMKTAVNTIQALPKATPIDISCGVSNFLRDDWLLASLKEVEAFNAALKTRTKFAAETVIARTAMKESIAALRQCTLQSRNNPADRHRAAGVTAAHSHDHWVQALKLFRSVWACACGDTKKPELVSFVNK